MLSIYTGKVNSPIQKEKSRVEFQEIVELIKSDYFKDKFETLQSLKYGTQEYREAKLDLNTEYFTPQSFSQMRNAVEGLSGIICFDFDIKENPTIDVLGLIELLKEDKQVLCFHKTTGNGLKIYSKCTLNYKLFKTQYNYIREYKEKSWGVILDKAFNKASQPCYLAYDLNIYYNEKAFIIPTPEGLESEETISKIVPTAKYNNNVEEVLNVVFFKLSQTKDFNEGNHHLFCVAFAYICKEYGVSKKKVKSFLEGKMGKKIETNCVSYPYSDDRCVFGTKELSEYTLIDVLKNTNNIEVPEELENTFIINDKLEEVYNKLIPAVQQGSLFLVAPMGVGKTHFALNTLPDYLTTNVIFTLPRKVQVEQVKREYPNVDADICTWDTLKYKNLENTTIIIDEAHLLVEDSEFRDVPSEVISLLKEVNNVVFLTATPNFNSEIYSNLISNLEFITVKKDVKKQDLNLRVFEKKELNNIINEVVATIKLEISKGNKVVVNYNSINTLKVIEKEMKVLNISTEVIHSSPKLNHSYSDGILNNQLTAEVTLTTKVFEVGLNIYNDNVSTIKIVNNVENSSSFLQFNARFRKGVTNSYLFLLKTNEKAINYNECKILMDRRYQKTLDLINIIKEEQELKQTIKHKEINSDYLTITKDKNGFNVDILFLLSKYNKLTNSYKRYINVINESYNIKEYIMGELNDNTINQTIKNEKKEMKDAQEVIINTSIEEVSANYNNLYYTTEKAPNSDTNKTDIAGENIYLQKSIINEIGFILSLKKRGVTSIDEYRTTYRTKQSRKDILLKLDIFLTKNIDISQVRSDYKKTHFIYQKLREFGTQILGKEMLFSTLLDGLSNIGIEEFNSRTIKSAFENIFEVKVKSKRVGDKVVKVITLIKEMNYTL